MESNKVLKVAVFNISIVAIIIVLFSNGLVGMELFGGGIIKTSISFVIIIVALFILFIGNFLMLRKPKPKVKVDDTIKTPEECIRALKRQNLKRTFAKDVSLIIKQTNRFDQKEETINNILLQKFNEDGMSYAKYKTVIQNLKDLFYMSIRSILNKLEVFDEEDYLRTRRGFNRYKSFPSGNQHLSGKFSNEFLKSKMTMYNEYINFVNESVEDNEEMLLKLDLLLLEISKFISIEEGQLEKMNAMIEIEDLIDKTKLYK